MDQERLALLKSLHLLDQIPDEQLLDLGRFLRPRALADGETVFEEGSTGESLFFVSRGQVRIAKRTSAGEQDLALLGPGDCFGEMALLEAQARSARAAALGPTVVLELAREELNRWLKERPQLAIGFFTELVQVQSQRLRRTSSELALLFDLSSLFLETSAEPKGLLRGALERVLPHLPGRWSGAAYLFSPFTDEMELAAQLGAPLPAGREPDEPGWLEDGTFRAPLRVREGARGYLALRGEPASPPAERAELGRALTTVARLLTNALDNISYRNEEALRQRLNRSTHGTQL